MKGLWCRLFGHGETCDWWGPWRREPTTGQWLDREVYTKCERCQATLSTRTVTVDGI